MNCGIHLKNIAELTELARRARREFGTCGLCGVPWHFVEAHTTPITKVQGCFPLCVNCWLTLTVDQRMPFYRQLWESWRDMEGNEKISWEVMEAAVIAEGE